MRLIKMSGNNPDLKYALNVLGNATVQGVLDATEIDIDTVTTEAVAAQTAAIQGVSTANTPVLTVRSASTTSTNVATFLAPSASPAAIVIGQSLDPSQHVYISGAANTMKFGVGGNTESLTLDNLGNATVTTDLTVSGLSASLPVLTNGSKKLVSASVTGTGAIVQQTSPSLVTPALGVASATSLSSGPVTVTGVSTANTSVIAATSASTDATSVASFLASNASTAGIIVGQGTGGSQHCYISHEAGGIMYLGIAGNSESLTLTGGAIALSTFKGPVKSTINTARYTLSAPAPWGTGSLTTVVNWTIDAGKSKGTALGYAAGVFTNDTGSDIVATVSWTSSRDANALGASTFYIVANSFNYAVQKVSGLDDACLSATFLVPSTETIRVQGFQDSGSGINFATSTNMLCITYYLVN